MKSALISKEKARQNAREVWQSFLNSPARSSFEAHFEGLLDSALQEESRILATIALPDELDLLAACARRGRPVYAPVTLPDGCMEFRLLIEGGQWLGPLVAGYKGVPGPHPKSSLLELPLRPADLALIPTRAVNPDGLRLGRGGGYYDRWLRALAPAKKVAVLPAALLDVTFTTDEHDLRLNTVVSELGTREY